MGVKGLQEDMEALVDGRFRDSFIDSPVSFIRNYEERVQNDVERQIEFNQGDLELSISEFDEFEPVYTIDRAYGRPLNPEELNDRAAEDFLDFWDEEVGDHSNVDAEYATQVLTGEREGSVEEVRERFSLQPHSLEVLEENEDPVYDTVTEELVQTLYGQALNRDEDFKDSVEAFERLMKNFDAEPYTELVENEHSYSVRHLTDEDEMLEAADESGSCIDGRERYFEEYADDEFSMVSEISKDGEVMGYMRNFVMDDELGSDFLAVDTMEIDHKNFNGNEDVVKAAGLASIQMMYDLGLDYVVGADSRVKYGVRQGYSNTEKSVTGFKPGPDVKHYTFNPSYTEGKSAYLLMENPG